ncbi:hypothetical protein J6W32_02895 [bacterium]|nr:hypothetical protein [bacterium]
MAKEVSKKQNRQVINDNAKLVAKEIGDGVKSIVKKTTSELNNDFDFTYDLVKGINKQINQIALVSKINW